MHGRELSPASPSAGKVDAIVIVAFRYHWRVANGEVRCLLITCYSLLTTQLLTTHYSLFATFSPRINRRASAFSSVRIDHAPHLEDPRTELQPVGGRNLSDSDDDDPIGSLRP